MQYIRQHCFASLINLYPTQPNLALHIPVWYNVTYSAVSNLL
jgi:hypothetical protein